MESRDEDRFLTAEEVATLLRLKVGTIYDKALKGGIPCVRLWQGRRRAVVRFVKDDIERFIHERRSHVRTKA
jgi:excisionase family DNA binding protein